MTTGFSIGGIASGLDTASMVQQLMEIERQPIYRIEQRQASLKKVDAAWSEVVTKVSAFRTALDKVRQADDWSSFVSASSSNEDAVEVTATGGGAPGSLAFTVTSLAARHQVRSSGSVASADTALTGSTFDVTVDGTTHSFALDGSTTLADLARQIDEAGVGVDAQVLKVAEGDVRLVLSAEAAGEDGAFTTSTDSQLGAGVVQRAGDDAVLTLPDGLEVRRTTNSITDLLDGVTIDLKATTTGPVEVATSRDTTKAADAVEAMVKAANDVLATLKKHTAYNAESNTSGVLQGDPAARSLQLQIRNLLSAESGGGSITHGSQLGISLTRTGDVTIDRTELEAALAADFDGVRDFMIGGFSGPPGATLVGQGDAPDGAYELQIDAAATRAAVTGSGYTAPFLVARTFQLQTTDGHDLSIDISTAANTAEKARQEIADQLAAAGVTSVTVSTSGGALAFESTSYGSDHGFTLSNLGDGLDGTHRGTDVSGSIDGEPATGSGRVLTTSDGLSVRWTGTATGAVGTLQVGEGLGGVLDRFLETVEGSGGSIQRSRDAIDGRIRDYDDQIEAFEARLDLREATIRRQFTGLETALAQLQSQGQWLAGQLGSLGGGSA